jgi:excisionase family DNA binding protein
MQEEITKYKDIHWVCEYLGKSQVTVYRLLRKKNGLPAHRIGGTWKFVKEEVDAWGDGR